MKLDDYTITQWDRDNVNLFSSNKLSYNSDKINIFGLSITE